MTDPAVPQHRDGRLGEYDFYRTHSLDDLLAGAEPLGSVDELAIDGLTDEEAEAFLAAIEG